MAPSLDGLDLLLLASLSVLSSGLTAAIGAGGGLLMLSAMANLLPPAAIIPVHGMVQLGSNLGRAWFARSAIDAGLARAYLAGAVCGAALGGLVLVRLPPHYLQLAIAAFVLWQCWLPQPRMTRARRSWMPWLGSSMTFLSLFVGAIGPPVLAVLRRLAPDRMATVATAAACLSASHLLKILAFGLAGFEWHAWLALVALLIVCGLLGTRLGLLLLQRLPERRFRQLLSAVLTLLALRLLWKALLASSLGSGAG